MCTLLSCTLVKPLNETLIVLVLTRLYSLICCRVSLTLLERPLLELYLFLPGAKSLVFSIILTAAVLHFTFFMFFIYLSSPDKLSDCSRDAHRDHFVNKSRDVCNARFYESVTQSGKQKAWRNSERF